MELARGPVVATPRRPTMVARLAASSRRQNRTRTSHAAFVVGGLGAATLVGVLAFTVGRPTAPVGTLIAPLCILTLAITAVAVSSIVVAGQPEQRSLNLLHRSACRILNGDTLGFVPPA